MVFLKFYSLIVNIYSVLCFRRKSEQFLNFFHPVFLSLSFIIELGFFVFFILGSYSYSMGQDVFLQEKDVVAVDFASFSKISNGFAMEVSGAAFPMEAMWKVPIYEVSVQKVGNGEITKEEYFDIGSSFKALDRNMVRLLKGKSGPIRYDSNDNVAIIYNEKGEKNPIQLSNIAPGEISETSHYVVTGSQLFKVNETLAHIENKTGVFSNELENFDGRLDTLNGDITAIKSGSTGLIRWDEKANALMLVGRDQDRRDQDRDVVQPQILTNLMAGRITESSLDAMSGSQLFATHNAIITYLGGGASYVDNQWFAPNYEIQGTGYRNIDDAFRRVDFSISHLMKDQNILKHAIESINGKSIEDSETIEDIAYGGQLGELEKKLKNHTDQEINWLNERVVTYDRDQRGNRANQITLQSIDDFTPVKITNLANGDIRENSKDAITGGQLYHYMNEYYSAAIESSQRQVDELKNDIGRLDEDIYQLNVGLGQLNQAIDGLDAEIVAIRNEARSAAAIGLAASSLRYDDRPGKISVASGGGYWKGKGALVFGAAYTSETGNVRSNVTGSRTGNSFGMSAGISFTLN